MPGGYDWGGWNALVALNTILANQRGDTKTASALTAGQLASDVVGMQNNSSSLMDKVSNAVTNPATIGAVVGSVVAPGLGSGIGAEAGAALGGATGQATTGDTNIRNLATVAALSGAGAGLGGAFGSTAASSAASGLTALGAGAGATLGAQLLSQDEQNRQIETPDTGTQTASGPGFSDIMKTDAQQELDNTQRRQQRLASGRKGTILTGTSGTNNAVGGYQRKTLLGS